MILKGLTKIWWKFHSGAVCIDLHIGAIKEGEVQLQRYQIAIAWCYFPIPVVLEDIEARIAWNLLSGLCPNQSSNVDFFLNKFTMMMSRPSCMLRGVYMFREPV